MSKKLLATVAALGGALLTACGGGSSSSTSVADVSLGGSFSKGLYANADVQAYEVIAGALVAIGSKVQTNANGEYTLTLKPTSNPVVIEMTTNASTTMLNEVDGTQPTPKLGTKMRTMLGELTTSMPEVHGNPFTEMAIEGAKNSPTGLTPASLAASKALVQDLTGIDPFSTKPVGDVNAAMNPNQEKLMTLMSALMLDAQNTKAGCAIDPTTGVACLLTTLNSKATLTTDNTGAFKFATPPTDSGASDGLKTLLNSKITNLGNDGTAAANSMAAKMRTKTAVVSLGNATQALTATDVLYRQGLDSFLQAMRGGFNQAEAAIKSRADAAKLRIDQVLLENAGGGLEILDDAMNQCTSTSGTLSCATGVGSIFTADSNGYTFTYDMTIDGLRAPMSGPAVYRYSGTIASSYSDTTGIGGATITANKVLIASSKKLSDLNIVFHGSGIKQDSLSGSVVLDAMDIKAYDQANGSSKWAKISLAGASLSGTRPSVGAVGTLTLVAPLVFTTSDGDSVSGKLNSLVAKEKIINSPSVGDKRGYPVSVDISLDAAVHEGALFGLGLVASQDIATYNPDLPSTANNQKNGNVLLTFKLADNVAVAMTVSKSTYDKTAVGVKITSNGNWINLSGKTKRTNLAVDEESMDGDIVVTSSGVYTANLRKSSGEIQGEIYKGTLQIGEVVNGIVKAGGVEISLR